MKNEMIFNDGSKIFFTSDTHFYHGNIMKYCNRPFSSVEEMNETLINNWNKVVPKDGIVFHLGDFGFCGKDKFYEILDRLNGKIYWVIGNHDWKLLTDTLRNSHQKIEAVEQQLYIQIEGQKIYLNHFPMLCYAGSWRGENSTWQLFGHVHTSPYIETGLDHQRLYILFPTQYDVGVDKNGFTPISFKQVKENINEQMLSLNMYRG